MEQSKRALDLIPPLPELRQRYAQAVEDLRVLDKLLRLAQREAIARGETISADSGGRPSR